MRICEQTGKHCHDSRADAARSLRTAPSRGMHTYRCEHCDLWHVGHGHDPARRGRPRLSGNARLRRRLGEAMARGDAAEARRIRDQILSFDRSQHASP